MPFFKKKVKEVVAEQRVVAEFSSMRDTSESTLILPPAETQEPPEGIAQTPEVQISEAEAEEEGEQATEPHTEESAPQPETPKIPEEHTENTSPEQVDMHVS